MSISYQMRRKTPAVQGGGGITKHDRRQIMEMKMLIFEDIKSGENLKDGIRYRAKGIVCKDFRDGENGSLSGKDFEVAFIDPLGEVQREWRACDEVWLTIDPCNFQKIKLAIEFLEKDFENEK